MLLAILHSRTVSIVVYSFLLQLAAQNFRLENIVYSRAVIDNSLPGIQMSSFPSLLFGIFFELDNFFTSAEWMCSRR